MQRKRDVHHASDARGLEIPGIVDAATLIDPMTVGF